MSDAAEELSQGQSSRRSVWTISIASSIVASAIFLIFFQPIINWMSAFTVSILSKVAISLLDSAYGQASMGMERAMLGYLVMALFITAINISGFPLIFSVVNFITSRKISKKDRNEKNHNGRAISRRPAWWVLTSLVPVFGFTYFFAVTIIGIQASTTFERYMSASAPYISDQEEELIRSKWAMMDSRSDYNEIIDQIEKRANADKKNLPKRLI